MIKSNFIRGLPSYTGCPLLIKEFIIGFLIALPQFNTIFSS